MNYSRGIQPSCCSKEQYEAENRKHWYKVEDNPPAEGQCVVVLHQYSSNDPDCWTTEIAYYCDEAFWNMEYDPNLGVMRKNYVGKDPEYWSNYIIHDPSELKD